MAIESLEGLRSFLNEDEFGVEVILNPDSTRNVIKGIFDNGFILVDAELTNLATTDPNVMVVTADVADVSREDPVEVNGISYNVKEIRPDGTGMSELMLTKSDD